MNERFVICTFVLMFAACASSGQSKSPMRSHDPKAVVGKTWQWQETVTPAEKITVRYPERYTFRLIDEGRAEFRFDCNRGASDFQISEAKLSFGPMMSTRMACPEGSLDAVYMKYMQDVNSFFIEGDSLYLELPVDSGTLRFREQSRDRQSK